MARHHPVSRSGFWKKSIQACCLMLLLLGSGLIVSAGQPQTGLPQTGNGILAQDLDWSGSDFSDGQSKGPLSKDSGLILTLPSTGVYTSPVILAPIPFSDLGCDWEADLPEGTLLLLELRTSPDREGDRWEPWSLVEEDSELPPMPFGQYAGDLLFVPQQHGVHQRLQYRISISSIPTDQLPVLHRLSCTFIDARAGPSTSEIVAQKGPPGTISSVDRPPLISREEWGCPEGPESPRWPPEYGRVTHVVVHHTVTPNDDVDWAARVRAIWYYHANTRGWGDIGYNYLVDPLGNVYEGRSGGEDVTGGHARSYNDGTMGIGNLGTYTSAPVPAPLQESMEALIAWKASQRGIDPLGQSFNNHKVYDHIAGHRDVGNTSCPGDVLYGQLPTIRQNVQTRLLQQEDATVIDELDPGFGRSPVYWHEGCGYADHSWWTHTTTDPALSANWGIWRPDLLMGGWYEVFAYVPSCTDTSLPEYTESAHYRIYYRDGGSTVVVNQQEEQGRWVSLGTYNFYAGTTGYVYLDDMADDHWHSLWYDAVRWVLRGNSSEPPPPPQLQSPEDGVWMTQREILLTWTIPPTATITSVNLVLSPHPDLSAPVVDVDLAVTDQYALSLAADYASLYWSVRGRNSNGYGPFAPIHQFGVDTTPPTSSIQGLYRSQTGVHFLMWGGTDGGSGIALYTVQMRDGTAGSWQDIWRDVPWTSGLVELPPEGIRYFRVHARDQLGYEEPPHGGDGDISSVEVTPLAWGWYQPLVLKNHVGPTRQPPSPRPSLQPTPSPTGILRPQPTATATSSPLPQPTATATPSPSPPPTEMAVPSPTNTRMPSPSPQSPPERPQDLPDLHITDLHSSQNSPFDCHHPSGIVVEVENLGTAAAGSFYIELSGAGLSNCLWHIEELLPGQHVERICRDTVLDTVVTATVDLENTVIESDEENNQLSVTISVLVLPTCTPRPND